MSTCCVANSGARGQMQGEADAGDSSTRSMFKTRVDSRCAFLAGWPAETNWRLHLAANQNTKSKLVCSQSHCCRYLISLSARDLETNEGSHDGSRVSVQRVGSGP